MVSGESSIVLLFEPGTDIMDARQLVQEQLTQAHANPNVSKPPQMIQPLSSQSRVMMIGIAPAGLTPIETSVLARWTIRPRLMGIPGVANVSMFGLRDRQLQALVDPERLRDWRVTLSQVIRTAGNAQRRAAAQLPGGLDAGHGRVHRYAQPAPAGAPHHPDRDPGRVARVPVDGSGGAGDPLRLGDVSTVVEDHQPLIGDAIVNDASGLVMVVEVPGDAVEVTRDVDEAIDELRPGLLAGCASTPTPSGRSPTSSSRRSTT